MRIVCFIFFVIFWFLSFLVNILGRLVSYPFEKTSYGLAIIANWFGVQLFKLKGIYDE